MDNVSCLLCAVNTSLKAGTVRSWKFYVEFRLDVFNFLFDGKGRDPNVESGTLYDKEDFDSAYFPDDWWIVLDRHGDSCCIDFPVRLGPTLLHRPGGRHYTRRSDGKLIEKPRYFSEVVFVTLVKKRC